MKRREFVKATGIAGAAGMITIVFPSCLTNGPRKTDPTILENSFLNPPDSARPLTWWHWMNGSVTKQGITLDIESMKKVGLGGFHLFEVASGIPPGPVVFGSPERQALLEHAAQEANRLDMSFTMHNCPGYTSSGGPWITPELSMQVLTWSETKVSGGKEVITDLKQPVSRLNYYKDALVLAVPTIGDLGSPLKYSINSGDTDPSLLTSDPAKGIELIPVVQGEPAWLQLEYPVPVEARSISVLNTTIAASQGGGGGNNQTASNNFTLQSSQDGVTFTIVTLLTASQRPSTGSGVLKGALKEGAFVPSVINFPPVTAKYFRVVSTDSRLISSIDLSGASRIPDYSGKAGFTTSRSNQTTAGQPYAVPNTPVIPDDGVIDITSSMDSEGKIKWTAPEGDWTLFRIGSTTSGSQNWPPPTGGEGLECDKLSTAAIEFHFEQFFGKLYDVIAPLAQKGVAGSLIDSWEVGNQNWSSGIPEEFRKRRGYDIKKYFPALFGYTVGSADTSDRFLWDFRKTLAEVMNEAYFKRFTELCHSKGWKVYIEPYDPGNFDEMLSGSHADMAMGEFWIGRAPHHGLKLATSVAHIYGKQVVGAESFTSTSKWTDYPYAIKSTGDYIFTLGINQYIFHRFAHQPHPDVAPGMTMGQWGSFWERTNTWYNKAQDWMQYCTRCQSILQQGQFVGDLLYFCGEESPARVLEKAALNPAPPLGYDWDSIDTNAIMTRIKIKDNNIVFPDGLQYRVLVLKNTDKMTVGLITKIKALVKQGMILVGPKPVSSPNLSDNDEDVKTIADEIWGDLDGINVKDRTYGNGKVFLGITMEEVLDKINLKPDMSYSASSSDALVNYIHKRVDETDIYFVANRRRRTEDVVLSFRVGDKKPELWDAETSEIMEAPVYDTVDGRVTIPIQFRQSGSVFVVFRSQIPEYHTVEIAMGSIKLLTATPMVAPKTDIYANLIDNFTISVWAKPEADGGAIATTATTGGGGGRNNATAMIIQPSQGEKVYGAGHATVGLIAGRGGVTVYERGTGAPTSVLSVATGISGWTHFVVVYRDGAPTLWVNGKVAGTSLKSGKIVHPETGEAGYAEVFQGHISKAEVFNKIFEASEVQTLYAAGIPKPDKFPALEPIGSQPNMLRFYENGNYSFKDRSGNISEVTIAGLTDPQVISGPWKVMFPPNLGAPGEITMDPLIPLNRHLEDGVRFFSGTATYNKIINIPDNAKSEGKKVFLDLGWVEVMAEVKLNGKLLGSVWKPPYRFDITDASKAGDNELEVSVTNLWPNRLIGDESFPAEYEYIGAQGRSGAISSIPDWFAKGEPRPKGQRIAFTTWKHYANKDEPLLESGLIGPVVIRTAIEKA